MNLKSGFLSLLLACQVMAPATTLASIKCSDIDSNSNYYLEADDIYAQAGSAVTFGKAASYDMNGPKLYEYQYSWGSGVEVHDPGSETVQYTANYEYFGTSEGLHQFTLDFLKAEGDELPPYLLLKIASGHGDYVIYKLSCTQEAAPQHLILESEFSKDSAGDQGMCFADDGVCFDLVSKSWCDHQGGTFRPSKKSCGGTL